jgi:hypothetical protein
LGDRPKELKKKCRRWAAVDVLQALAACVLKLRIASLVVMFADMVAAINNKLAIAGQLYFQSREAWGNNQPETEVFQHIYRQPGTCLEIVLPRVGGW